MDTSKSADALHALYAVTTQSLAAVSDLADAEVSDAEEMACFDELPPALRDVVAGHVLKVTAQSVLGRWVMLRRSFGDRAVSVVVQELAAMAAHADPSAVDSSAAARDG